MWCPRNNPPFTTAAYRHLRRVVRSAALAAPIPALRPPHEPIPPSLWERYGWTLALAFVVAGVGVFLWARRNRSRSALPPMEPLAIARAKLAALDAGEDAGGWPDLVSQILRWSLLEHFRLPWLEYTTEELQAMLEQKRFLPGELIEEWRCLLEDCDRARFATDESGLAGRLRTRAMELLERISKLPASAAGGASDPARTS